MSGQENWGAGDAYERYAGRWSREVARRFIEGLDVPRDATWADVGCGTGALTERILELRNPSRVVGIDRSEGFVAHARAAVRDPRASFETGDATALPWEEGRFDAAVSGLVLNFVREPAAMASEMARVTRPGGRVAAYVWDYAGGMQMMRWFWDVAIEQNRGDARLDQAERFPVCRPEPLAALFRDAGLEGIGVRAIDIPMIFRDFDDYWQPFLGRQGAAPTYLASLSPADQARLREALHARLPANVDGSIVMSARAWAVEGRRADGMG